MGRQPTMKTLSSPLTTALAAPVQRPGLLVQVGFSSPVRWCSYGAVTWNGLTWAAEDVSVESLQVDALRVSGTLVIGNADDVAGALVLSEGIADKTITLWSFDAGATALADVVWLCDAVGAGAEVGSEQVRINLRHRSEFGQAPRTFVNPAAGFNNLLPPQAVLRINGVDWRMSRRGPA